MGDTRKGFFANLWIFSPTTYKLPKHEKISIQHGVDIELSSVVYEDVVSQIYITGSKALVNRMDKGQYHGKCPIKGHRYVRKIVERLSNSWRNDGDSQLLWWQPWYHDDDGSKHHYMMELLRRSTTLTRKLVLSQFQRYRYVMSTTVCYHFSILAIECCWHNTLFFQSLDWANALLPPFYIGKVKQTFPSMHL